MILLNVLDTFAGSESVKPCPGYLGDLWPWLPLGGEQGNHKHISISSVITREKNKRERERGVFCLKATSLETTFCRFLWKYSSNSVSYWWAIV